MMLKFAFLVFQCVFFLVLRKALLFIILFYNSLLGRKKRFLKSQEMVWLAFSLSIFFLSKVTLSLT